MEINKYVDSTASELVVTVASGDSDSAVLYWTDRDTGESGSVIGSGSTIYEFALPEKYLRYDATLDAYVTFDDSDDVSWADEIIIQRSLLERGISSDYAAQISITRALIESVTGPIYFKRKTKRVYGTGTDYLFTDEDLWKIYSITNSGESVYDIAGSDQPSLRISPDRRVINVYETGENLVESQPVWYDRYRSGAFPYGYDYDIDGDWGWPSVPGDIRQAADLVFNDLLTGSNSQFTQGILEFDNREFKVKYDHNYGVGSTGNKTADLLLDRYRNDFTPGVI